MQQRHHSKQQHIELTVMRGLPAFQGLAARQSLPLMLKNVQYGELYNTIIVYSSDNKEHIFLRFDELSQLSLLS